ncbi:alpha-1,3/1,6-mannosyltransferase ALG2 [Chelonus insularis]|uniref:alpha-1,3/1,6-mannosyltransferase ALG2 n=1 Tax=Chelonus insularis TaxID=460826 RepID=UPI00158C87CE|nr:alpha-1,3/1,6-mannosyltransferase ALG2 [Chelonus insularis]
MARVTFLHPDLGIGGAERLVVDAALALKKQNYHVNIVTTFHDPNRCFTETKDGTLPVTVVGNWLPRHIFGKFYALCAYIRMMYAAIAIYFMDIKPDIVICDLVSACIPILRLFVKKIVFYCHHPDQLLTQPGGKFKTIYRSLLDYFEEITTGRADKIFVNSIYTRKVFKNTFKSLNINPEILYPSIHTEFFDQTRVQPLEDFIKFKFNPNNFIILSINRYERKKNLSIAIDAFHKMKDLLTNEEYEKIYLIMAGGYDERIVENVEHYQELVNHAKKLNINDKIIFFRSPTDEEKVSLLSHCKALIYTPENEHFGIVPLEAMYFKKPVVAHNSGGPTETIVDGETGFLVKESTPEAFAEKIVTLFRDENMRTAFGNAGKERVVNSFSFDAFSRQLHRTIEELISEKEAIQ